MARQAVIHIATGLVTNVIELDGGRWTPPAGHEIRPAQRASIGDTWNGTVFVKAADPTPPQRDVDRASAISKLRALGLSRAEIDALLN